MHRFSTARSLVFMVIVLVFCSAGGAHAEDRATPEPGRPAWFHGDVEVDPTAYVLNGYSLHVGLGFQRVRVDLGAYAMELPGWVQDHHGFEPSFHGYGIKLQYFLLAEQRGAFVGIDTGVVQLLLERRDSQLADRQTQYSAGGHAGWRFDVGAGFYATAWLGVGYAFGARDVTLGKKTYEVSSLVIFPAVHVGYRFR